MKILLFLLLLTTNAYATNLSDLFIDGRAVYWEVDNMEYATDNAVQGAWVTDAGYTSDLIPTMTGYTSPSGEVTDGGGLGGYYSWEAMMDDNSDQGNSWAVQSTSGWIQYEFTSAKTITRYTITSRNEPATRAPKSWTLKGSNNGSNYATLDTQSDVTDWAGQANVKKTFDIDNSTPYTYYKLDITASNDATYVGVGEFELITSVLQSYSEDTIVQQGSYSLKGIATTDALNDTLTKTTTLDLSNSQGIEYDIRASRTGSNIKIGLHDSGGTTSEHTANVSSANTNQTESWDISGIADANKDDIDEVIITILNDDAENTFYIDDLKWGIDAAYGDGSW